MSWDDIREPSADFVSRVLAIVTAIPPGRVMTYGDIADQIGTHPDLDGTSAPFGARLVGRVMARSGEGVPWWRVIRATGQPPKFHEADAWTRYLAEGTPLSGSGEDYRIDLKRARWRPGDEIREQRSLGL